MHVQYIYKGLMKADNSGLLLKIHAQLVEKCGLGTFQVPGCTFQCHHAHLEFCFLVACANLQCRHAGCIVRAITDRKTA